MPTIVAAELIIPLIPALVLLTVHQSWLHSLYMGFYGGNQSWGIAFLRT